MPEGGGVKKKYLEWVEKHGITTLPSLSICDDADEWLPWIAWDKSNDNDGTPNNLEKCGYGITENDALMDLCVTRGFEYWADLIVTE